MADDDDEMMRAMAAQTAAITAAETERAKAIDAAEKAADEVIEAHKDE